MEHSDSRSRLSSRIAWAALIVCLLLALDPFNLLIENRSNFVDRVLKEDLAALASLLAAKSGLCLLSHTSVSIVVATIEVGELASPLVDLCTKGIDLLLGTTVILGVIKCALTLLANNWFKLLIVLAGLAMWPRVTRPFGARCLALLLMLNPGLPLYLGLCQGVAHVIGHASLNQFSEGLHAATGDVRDKLEAGRNELADDAAEARASDSEIVAAQSDGAAKDAKAGKGWWDKTKSFFVAAKDKLSSTFRKVSGAAMEKVKSLREKVTAGLEQTLRALGEALTVFAARAIVLYVLMPIGYYILLRFAMNWAIEGFKSDLRGAGRDEASEPPGA